MNRKVNLKSKDFYSKEFLSHKIHIMEYELMVELKELNPMLIDRMMF
jgi:hypothetical protein